MNNKLKYFLIIISILIITIAIVWRYIQQTNTDYSNQKPVANFTFTELMKKIESDTTNLKSNLIGVSGPIKKIAKDSNLITIELGYDSTMNSIICQIDERYTEDFEALKESQLLNIKGIVSGINTDDAAIFGNTIELKYCTQNN